MDIGEDQREIIVVPIEVPVETPVPAQPDRELQPA